MSGACPQKPGLSAVESLSNVVSTLNAHDIPTGALPDGTENKILVIVNAILTEVFRALREDANIQVSYGPGSITVMTTGANGGGPMISQGVNINFGKGQAIIQ